MLKAKAFQGAFVPVLVFVIVCAVYLNSRVTQSMDSRWSIHTAISMMEEWNIDLNEYHSLIPYDDYRVIRVHDRIYPLFPVGGTLMAAPIVFVYGRLNSQVYQDVEATYSETEILAASTLTALTAVIVFLIARSRLNTPQALGIVFVFAFATSAWSTASRALWQHGPSMLVLSFALYLIVLAEKRPALIQLSALPLAFSFTIRPTNIIAIFFMSLYVLVCHRKYFCRYILLIGSITGLFFAFNKGVYGTWLTPYYLPARIGRHPQLLQALIGNLISPSRGLFVFSPVLLFTFYGFFLREKRKWCTALDGAVSLIILCHWVSISSYPHWWAGHSFGPRLFADVMPFFCYLLIPVVAQLTRRTTNKAFLALFALSCVFSAGVHARGATDQATFDWNLSPTDIDTAPSRVWNWTDIQFLRGFTFVSHLVRPQIVASPPSMVIWPQQGKEPIQIVEFTILDVHNRVFDWQAKASLGIEGLHAKGKRLGLATLVAALPHATACHRTATIDLP